MADYLSPAWFEAADRALSADPGLAEATRGIHLVLQQSVGDPASAVTWHIRIDDGSVRLVPAPADDATVTFHCDRDTAEAVHRGTTSAQAAFMAGHLRVGGDVGALLTHQELLAGLGDVLGHLRTNAG